MDILQFVSSIIGSVAWPFVVLCFLFLIRKQVIPLARRLSEVSLPGGTKASFREELEGAKDQALSFAVGEQKDQALSRPIAKPLVRPNVLSDSRIDQAVKQDKAETIWDVYEKTEEYMRRKIQKMPLDKRRIPADFVFHNLRQVDGGPELYDMYRKIQDISMTSRRSSALEVDRQDIMSYRDICNIYLRRFDDVTEIWLKNLPMDALPADQVAK